MNTSEVPNRSSPLGGVRAGPVEHLFPPRLSRQTAVLPSPDPMLYATTRLPSGSIATDPVPFALLPMPKGLSSGCGEPLTTPAFAAADAAPPSPADRQSSTAVIVANVTRPVRLVMRPFPFAVPVGMRNPVSVDAPD